MQEAFALAAERWPRDGSPSNPRAWLVTTAGTGRSTASGATARSPRRRELLEVPDQRWTTIDDATIPDERLELIFTCCHPALALDAQVALTLRTLGGLTTEELARAFLFPRRPWPSGWCGPSARSGRPASRSGSRPTTCSRIGWPRCSRSIYLIFNEGYRRPRRTSPPRRSASAGALVELMPDEPEARGLLALMLLHDARREARFADGELVLLADQDRSLWDAAQIVDGRRRARPGARAAAGAGPYVLQAAIAALHAEEPPDWAQIAALYGELAELTGSPVVELNRAVAVAEAGAPGEAASGSSSSWSSTTTTTSTRPAPSCCGASAARRGARGLRARARARRRDAERRLLERRLREL